MQYNQFVGYVKDIVSNQENKCALKNKLNLEKLMKSKIRDLVS